MKIKHFVILSIFLVMLVIPAGFASDDLDNATAISQDASSPLAQNASYFSQEDENIEEPLLDDSFSNTRFSVTEKNTFYVNSSYEGESEVGSIDSPFKNIDKAFSGLTLNRSISNIYIASGEYAISKKIDLTKNLNIIGENPVNTIISGKNSSQIFLTNKNGLSLNIVNLTFTQGNNYYGGAIYNNRSTIKLINTIFRQNYAVGYNTTTVAYSPAGGALYNEAGIYRIYNSTFVNNVARSSLNVYAAAIYNDLGTISILNSKFINNTLDDGHYGSGGAIYNFNGFLTVFNSTFENNRIYSNYSIGGAIYNYEAHNVYVINSTFDGNDIYGNYTLGSAIASSASLFEVVNSTFSNNFANGTAFSNSTILNINGIYNFINSTMDNNTIRNEKASIFMCLEDQFVISKAFDDSLLQDLPSKYDLRDYGLVTNAKSQGSSGACWAFSTLAALESYLLMYENATYDLSENNLKNVMNYKSVNGTDWVDGGNYQMALAYFLRWSGPVDEDDDSFSAYSVIPNYDLEPLKHVQGAMFLPMRLGYLDNDQIKYAIMKYGALYTSIDGISMTKSEYKSIPEIPNHAVAIVGWDDDYPASRFIGTKPPGDGAFIIKNSWGSSYGERGFGYVSYYDKTFAGFSLDSISAMAFTDVENITNYKEIYQYDILGNTYESLGFGSNIAWLANQFTALSNNPLSAFGFYTYGASDYLIDVYVNGDLKYSQKGNVGYAGYHTVKLNEIVSLVKGDTFRLNLRLNTFDSIFPISIESARDGYSSKATSQLNQSFVSADGVNWIDIAQDFDILKISGCFYNKTLENANVCLKAYTANCGDLQLNITSDSKFFYRDDEISFMFNLTNSGDYVKDINVSLILDDAMQLISVSSIKGNLDGNIWKIDELKNGESAVLNLTYRILENKLSIENMAFITSSDYLASDNLTVGFNLDYAGQTIIDVENKTILSKSKEIANIVLLDALSQPISNAGIVVNADGKNTTFTTDENGTVKLSLDLNEGTYTYTVYFDGSEPYLKSNASFTVNVFKRQSVLAFENKIVYYYSDPVSVFLYDGDGNALENRTVSFRVNGNTYNSTTVNGIASVSKIKAGNYTVVALFEGDEYYNSSDCTFDISIIKKTTKLTANNINTNAVVVKVDGKTGPYLKITLKENGNLLANKKIQIKLYSKTQYVKTNSLGVAKLQINIEKSGTYTAKINFLGDDGYYKSSTTSKIVIKKKKMSLKVPKKTFKRSLKIKKLTATLKDNKGKAISAKKITFKVNGRKYVGTTNKKGVASVKIKITKKKTYTVVTTFKGDSAYNKITTKSKLVIK